MKYLLLLIIVGCMVGCKEKKHEDKSRNVYIVLGTDTMLFKNVFGTIDLTRLRNDHFSTYGHFDSANGDFTLTLTGMYGFRIPVTEYSESGDIIYHPMGSLPFIKTNGLNGGGVLADSNGWTYEVTVDTSRINLLMRVPHKINNGDTTYAYVDTSGGYEIGVPNYVCVDSISRVIPCTKTIKSKQ